jgi:uncharacterized protein YgiM (DUF1202 family)
MLSPFISPGVYTTFGSLIKWARITLCRACCLGVLFGLVTGTFLHAAEIHYVNSPDTPLNMRRGPGMEYSVMARLPHGTRVLLQERSGLWYRVTLPDSKTEGWVLQRYLTTTLPTVTEAPGDMNPEEERRRFDRLQRKDVITLQQIGATLRMGINPLVWHRLTWRQQSNFLQRARRLYRVTTVELHDRRNNALLARLPATGDMETYETPRQASPDNVPRPQTEQRP